MFAKCAVDSPPSIKLPALGIISLIDLLCEEECINKSGGIS